MEHGFIFVNVKLLKHTHQKEKKTDNIYGIFVNFVFAEIFYVNVKISAQQKTLCVTPYLQ